MKVIGTAGHVDHGKSTLVERLTGIDPDRLGEEKRRGMTIDLGFAWLNMPSGDEVSIVDVPGHERFIKNMLAGAGGIDVALMVVAADEGVMPQTREHLDILDLLSVRLGVVALTKIDSVDDEWADLVGEEVREVLAGTSLASSTIVPVSAVTGEGLNQLLDALQRVLDDVPPRRSRGHAFLPVDRVFTVPGHGTVVTGTLHDGVVKLGDEVEVLPGGRRARIRSLQTHRKQVAEAEPGARVAANLLGHARSELQRGDVLAEPGTIHVPRRFDASFRLLATAPAALRHGAEVQINVGAAERRATIAMLGQDQLDPGMSGWVQVRITEPVAIVPGQRFIVRWPAPVGTIGGGQVVDVAPRHRRYDRKAVERLSDMASGEPDRVMRAALSDRTPRTAKRLEMVLRWSASDVGTVLVDLERRRQVVPVGSVWMAPDAWTALRTSVAKELDTYHARYPMRQGIPRQELRAKIGFRGAEWAATQRRLEEEGILVSRGAFVADATHKGGTAGREREVARIMTALEGEAFSPPSGQELLDLAGGDAGLLSALADEGRIVRVGEGLYLAHSAYRRMLAGTLELIESQGNVTVARVRDAFGTSRKYALAFLEHLDAERYTRRNGDVRLAGSKTLACE